MTPTEQDKELREKLSAIEHERWADWQRYVHSVCYENKGIGGEPTGELIIPSELARGWERQIGTPYQELTEKEKDSDREQVDRYWQLITAQINQARIDENNMYIKELTRHHFPAGRGEPHIPLVQFHERIAELINNQIEKSEIFVPVKGCSVNRSARAILRSNT